MEIPFDYSGPLKARSTAPYQVHKRRVHSRILGIYPPYGVIVISYALFENGVNAVLGANCLMK